MGDFPTDQFADWAGATWDRGKTSIKYEFYDDTLHREGQIPPDAQQISEKQRSDLLQAQATGKRIIPDANGKPVAADIIYTFAQLKQRKLDDLADYRWQRETAGISMGGATIKTDRESQSLLNGALKLFDLSPNLAAIKHMGILLHPVHLSPPVESRGYNEVAVDCAIAMDEQQQVIGLTYPV